MIGGYTTHTAKGERIAHKDAAWFMLELNRKTAPWAYDRGEPFRAIASLGLLGTDNLGNRFALAKLLTTKWPLSAFLAELACQLESRSLLLEMHWVPRAQNSEADAITNGDVQWLCKDNEIKIDLEKLPFEMLHVLLDQGKMFYKDIEAINAADDLESAVHKIPLRVRDPWDQ